MARISNSVMGDRAMLPVHTTRTVKATVRSMAGPVRRAGTGMYATDSGNRD